jgi:hypothetical protein
VEMRNLSPGEGVLGIEVKGSKMINNQDCNSYQ